MIRAVFVIVSLTLFALVAGPPLLLYSILSGSIHAMYDVGVGGVAAILRAAGMRTRVEGLENIPPGTCLFAANHTSLVDPVAIVPSIPRRIGILAKKSLFDIPLVGAAFRRAHYVPIDRGNRQSALESLDEAARKMRQGISYLIYPEGTRSPDGRLGRFKMGAFTLAVQAGVPVVPVACAGAQRVLPKKSLRFRPGEVLVRFCPPVETAGMTLEQRGELAARVRAAIAAALPPEQRPAAELSESPPREASPPPPPGAGPSSAAREAD